jgi:hypothetical protein
MAFNLKNKLTSSGLSRKSSSPLNNNDLTGAANLANVDLNKANVTNTASVKDLSGKDFATERIITTPGKKVEKQASSNQAYLDSFSSEFSKAKEGGFEGTLPEYIKQKEKKAGYQGEEIKQKRDYSTKSGKDPKKYNYRTKKDLTFSQVMTKIRLNSRSIDYDGNKVYDRKAIKKYKDDANAWAKENNTSINWNVSSNGSGTKPTEFKGKEWKNIK